MQQKLWYECQGQNVQCKADLYTEQNRIKIKNYTDFQLLQNAKNLSPNVAASEQF